MDDTKSAPKFDADHFFDADYLRGRAARFRALAAEHRAAGNLTIAATLFQLAADLEGKADKSEHGQLRAAAKRSS